ncbi:hypothetical protein L798_06405 [Zootermopsis nevadensis]|uniref:Uncharacterized protein n=1 Tax=Zootermopsis nevadensis TaxID=136037 RepID=A0A067RIE4_ZOONE|nr:hypothetical protein L798_06405 [Zootermopsis nevadensis]
MRVTGACLRTLIDTWYLSNYLIPFGGSQCTLNELEVIELLSNVTLRGRRGTVLY